jgi:glycosyltransferase involved in cell wall biosynthesis
MFLFLVPFVPFISVIITAHNRREFLLEAVNSALNQTLPKDEYEIIVVKNFEDERIDKFLEEHNVKNIVTKEEPLGAKIVKGVEESRGEVVSFLEDDDLWLPQKLEIVRQIFKDKDVIYYHNNFSNFVDHINIDVANIVFTAKSRLLRLKASDIKDFGVLMNNSSVSVRKCIFFEEQKEYVKKVTISVDNLLAYLAYCYNKILVLDDRVLTLRRIHKLNASPDGIVDYYLWLVKLAKTSKFYMSDHLLYLNMFSSFDCKVTREEKERLIKSIEGAYLDWKVTYSRLPNTKNEVSLKELIKYLKYKHSFKSVLYGFLPFAPKKIRDYATKIWYNRNLRKYKN